MLLISTPSIKILPPALSKIQNNAKAGDDFSANVWPTIAVIKWLSEVDWGSVKSKIGSLSFYFGNLINAELEMFSHLSGVMLEVILQPFASHSEIFLGV